MTILFILYTQPLTSVILKHPVSHMLYADDTQVYKSFDADDCLSSILCVEKCVSDVKDWMTLISFKRMTTKRMSYLLLNELLTCSNFQNS